MKLRTKLFLIWGSLVVLLWTASLWPVHQAAVSGIDQLSAQAFDGTTQGLRTIQAARVAQMRQACQLVMNIPDLRALIAESSTELTPDNLDSLQERLDSLAGLVSVRCVAVLNWQATLVAQNNRSPWDSLSQLRTFLGDSPQAAALIHTLFHPEANASHLAQDALWQYNGQFYDVVGVPLTFSTHANQSDQPAPVEGALIMATPLSDDIAAQLASGHDCDVSFIAGSTLTASSLPPEKRNVLANLFANNQVRLPDESALELLGVTYRASMLPLVDPCSQTLVGGMWIQTDLQKARAASATAWHELFLVIAIGLILAAVGSFYFSGFITKPIDALVDAVRRVADGDFQVSIAPSTDRGELAVLSGAFNEMVSQLRTQRHLQKLVESSRAANSAKSQFLANMSHEIRTPLHGVVGVTDLLLHTNLDERQRKYVGLVKNSAEVLSTLISDILDFSKIEAGKLELETIDFNLRSVVADVIDLLSQRANSKHLNLIENLPDDLPRSLAGDPNRLRQILINLVNNAIKFTETGSVSINASIASRNDDAVTLRFEVADTGIGIPADRMDRLFQSFSQVDASTTRKYGGTGLGLAISKQLVELMGGQIGVTSAVNHGTSFWFTAVFTQVAAPPTTAFSDLRAATPSHSGQRIQPASADRPGIAAAAASEPEPAAIFRILVAEDNEINQIVARELLVAHGYECELVSDGRQALDAALSARFDLILMDCQMPELDGMAATRLIRQREQESAGLARGQKRIPIIALTANASGADRQECFNCGMDGYCGKPFHPTRLVQAIRSLLDAAQPVPAPAPAATADPRAIPAAEESILPTANDSSILPSAATNQPLPIPEPADPIEMADLLARCTGKPELANTVLQKFQTQSSQALDNLRQCVQQLNAVQLAAIAHTLKGTAGLVAASGVAKIAASIEQAGHDADFNEAEQLLNQLQDEVQRCALFVAQAATHSAVTPSATQESSISTASADSTIGVRS